MRRMITGKQAELFDNVVANGTKTEVGGDLDVAGSINGNVVRKMTAPASTTLTEAEVELLSKGVFIEGNFLGYKNPIIGPAYFYGGAESRDYAKGLLIADGGVVTGYVITMSTRVITPSSSESKTIQIQAISSLNGKVVPSYPSSTGTFVLKCVNGALTWIEE